MPKRFDEVIDIPLEFFELISVMRNPSVTGTLTFVQYKASASHSEWVEFNVEDLAEWMRRHGDTARRGLDMCSKLGILEVTQAKSSDKRLKARIRFSEFARVIAQKRRVNEEKRRLRGLKKGTSSHA